MQVPLLDLKAQFAAIKDDVLPAINEVCASQMVCLGPAVAEFEKQVADFIGCGHALGVTSGSDALIAALMALDIGPGDEVITTPFTFFATAGAISRVGATPVFVDIEADSFNIDPTLIEAKITDKTKALLPVHLFGQAANMEALAKFAKSHNLAIVEDAAQAIGASRSGVNCGAIGDLGCFSFYPTKNLGAFGDAGLVTTNDDELAAKLRIIRDHGQNPRYYYHRIGGNFRMDGIQGAVLSVKLKHLPQWNQQRQANAKLYDELLADSPVQTPVIDTANKSVYHQYTIRVPKRDGLQQHLSDKGIGCAVFYPLCLHQQPCFADLGHQAGDFPQAEKAAGEVLSLPIFAELTEEQIKTVAQAILEFCG